MMFPVKWRSLLALAIMIGSTAAAVAIRPENKLADGAPPFRLESIVPVAFGDWRIDTNDVPILPSPELQAAINRAYEQTIDRTYVDSHGHHVMLSIAFSGNYDKGMQWHQPENCYPSQGFTIETPTSSIEVPTSFGPINAAQLVARRGQRVEPITYWFILGDRQARFGLDLRWHQVLYGLSGAAPSGLLIRVSSVGSDIAGSFSVQEAFANELVASVKAPDRHRFLGAMAGTRERSTSG
jgi:EpsI family protein